MSKQITKYTKHEVRLHSAPQKFEIRRNADGTRTIAGYFAVFNSLSEDLGFREIVRPGAFKKSLAETNPDVICYFNHNTDLLLGRVSSGTLEVEEDSKGLRFLCQLPDTSTANDLIALIERGDISACSFGFQSVIDIWSELPDGQLLREITEAIVYEGSVVISPAYAATSVSLRSLPKSLRGKLKRASDSGAEDTEDEDDTGSEDKRCECDCDACEDGDCDECTNPDCTYDDCDDCPIQTRAAHLQLLIRRLK